MTNPTDTRQTVENLRPNPTLVRSVKAAGPALGGTLLPCGAILWAHAENFVTNEQAYLVQPPTVSRALTNPLVTEPFAIVMLIGAILLLIATAQLVTGFFQLLQDHPAANTRFNRFLLVFCAIFEVPAILGMVVLSQYTGDAHSLAHDTGSYMLFFGHSFAIIACGILVRRVLRVAGAESDPRLKAIAGHPAHAAWVAVCSLAFGLSYFGGKIVPDQYSYAQHLLVSLTEIAVLFAFLSFLGRFWKFLSASAAIKALRQT